MSRNAGIVYFIRAVGTSFVKIGVTDELSILKRLSALQTGCPHLLTIEGTFPGDEMVERMLHSKVRGRRHRGEWFQLSESEVAELLAEAPGIAERKARLREMAMRGMLTESEVDAEAPLPATPEEMTDRAHWSMGDVLLQRVHFLRSIDITSDALLEAEALGRRLSRAMP